MGTFHSGLAGFHLGILSWGEAHGLWPRREEGRLHNYNYWQYLWGGGELGQFGGEVELFGGEASPAPPFLDETLPGSRPRLAGVDMRLASEKLDYLELIFPTHGNKLEGSFWLTGITAPKPHPPLSGHWRAHNGQPEPGLPLEVHS